MGLVNMFNQIKAYFTPKVEEVDSKFSDPYSVPALESTEAGPPHHHQQTHSGTRNDEDDIVGAPFRSGSVVPTSVGVPVAVGGGVGQQLVVAIYTFQGRSAGELSFQKGDRLEVLSETNNDWWLARNLANLTEGYIPQNHVALASSLECKDWYFGSIARKEAETLLMDSCNQRGTFLIRLSKQASHGYSLSIRGWDQTKGEHVKHYRIKQTDAGVYFITSVQAFGSLNELVETCSRYNHGLVCLLQHPCARPRPQQWDLSRETKDQWEIERNTLTFIRKLGQGSFGDVWYGTWNNQTGVAIKMLREGNMKSSAFLEEAAIMKGLRHRNILVLYAVCSKEEPVLIVTECMKKGALLELLRSDEGKALKLSDMIYIASQVAAGMAYLESKQLIHRDLAARNVLVGESLLCKVADFGLARLLDGEYYCPSTNNQLPLKWTAPEAIIHSRFTIKSDVWSFGVLLMEIITFGANPYPGMNNREVIEHVQNGNRMPKPPLCPEEHYKMMITCWDKDPDLRPTFDYLHHYFDDNQVSSEHPCARARPQQGDLSRETKDQWEIERKTLIFIRKLRQGSFGDVWYGTWNNRIEVAIKTLREGSMKSSAFLEEAAIMKGLRHCNILVLYAVCSKEEPVLIVTEYMKKGALLELLRSDEGKALKLNDMIYIASQVAAGMAYLESKQVIHRDLAARNVHVDESLLCKVTNFGLARLLDGEYYCSSTNIKIPVKWTAPEAMLFNRFTIKSDVWSFGVLLMEIIIFGANPYPGMNNREVIERVQKGYRMPKPLRCPEELYKMMITCWDKDPDLRPTFDSLHRYFDHYQGSSEITYRDGPHD